MAELTVAEQREAVAAHPPLLVTPDGRDEYDLREIALWILDHPEQAEYRLSDWWNAKLRAPQPGQSDRWNEAFAGRPVYFLSFSVELGAYRLIAHACRGEVYAPEDLDLMLRGGAPA